MLRNKMTEEEFVFHETVDEMTGGTVYLAHRIYIRAGKAAFIEREPYTPDKHQMGDMLEWREYRHKCIAIPREPLEEHGRATCPKTGEVYVQRPPVGGMVLGFNPLVQFDDGEMVNIT